MPQGVWDLGSRVEGLSYNGNTALIREMAVPEIGDPNVDANIL